LCCKGVLDFRSSKISFTTSLISSERFQSGTYECTEQESRVLKYCQYKKKFRPNAMNPLYSTLQSISKRFHGRRCLSPLGLATFFFPFPTRSYFTRSIKRRGMDAWIDCIMEETIGTGPSHCEDGLKEECPTELDEVSTSLQCTAEFRIS